jgi:hypothetical protein
MREQVQKIQINIVKVIFLFNIPEIKFIQLLERDYQEFRRCYAFQS